MIGSVGLPAKRSRNFLFTQPYRPNRRGSFNFFFKLLMRRLLFSIPERVSEGDLKTLISCFYLLCFWAVTRISVCLSVRLTSYQHTDTWHCMTEFPSCHWPERLVCTRQPGIVRHNHLSRLLIIILLSTCSIPHYMNLSSPSSCPISWSYKIIDGAVQNCRQVLLNFPTWQMGHLHLPSSSLCVCQSVVCLFWGARGSGGGQPRWVVDVARNNVGNKADHGVWRIMEV